MNSRQRPTKAEILKIQVGVLGATEIVGQEFVALLADHPWFELRSVKDRESCEVKRRWYRPRMTGGTSVGAAPGALVSECGPRLMFSALGEEIRGVEETYAETGHYVFSSACRFRVDSLIPVLVPEVNGSHIDLVASQQKSKKWSGRIIAHPNPSVRELAIALAALRDFDVRRVVATKVELPSCASEVGAWLFGVPASIDPSPDAQEGALEEETRKILGRLDGCSIVRNPMLVSASAAAFSGPNENCTLVAVELTNRVSAERVVAAFREFSGASQAFRLPSLPTKSIIYHNEFDCSKPLPHAKAQCSMAVEIARVRKCGPLGYCFLLLQRSNKRSSASAAILNAEFMIARALVPASQ